MMLVPGKRYMIADVRAYTFRRFIGRMLVLKEVLEEHQDFTLIEAVIDGDTAHFVFWARLVRETPRSCKCPRLSFPHQWTKLCQGPRT